MIQTVSIVPGGTNSTINESYDAEGHMTTYVDPDGNTTSYVYNVDNELVAEINPLGTTSYSYNSAGEMIANIDADGGTIADVYNGDGQVTTETWMVGTTVYQTANYSYNSVGELTYAANPAATYSYQYNSLGQKTQQIFTDANGDALTQNYTYDASGNLSQETDSQGNTLQYTYNGLGELTTEIATSSTGTIARSQFSYNANGQVAQIQDYTVASAGTAVLTINDSYDVNGNLTTEIETGSGVSVTYINSYDADNRITSEVRNGVTTTYGYNAESEITTDDQTNSFDANGNLTNAGFTIGTYNEVVRSDGAAGTWSYYYDGVGNLVKEINQVTNVTWNYAYDFDFRLTSAIERNSGGTILESGTYSYDVYGNLVGETITSGGSTTTEKFAYNDNQIYADMNSAGTITTLYDTGMGSGTLYGRIQSGTIYWIGQDYQGSVRDIFNAAGSSDLDVISYEGDGLLNTQTGAQYLGSYAYTGLRYDSLTTFYVALDRWYNTATVQWLELDPIGVNGGLPNFRSYVGDDWANRTDLSGLSVFSRAWDEVGLVAGYVIHNPRGAANAFNQGVVEGGKNIGNGVVATARVTGQLTNQFFIQPIVRTAQFGYDAGQIFFRSIFQGDDSVLTYVPSNPLLGALFNRQINLGQAWLGVTIDGIAAIPAGQLAARGGQYVFVAGIGVVRTPSAVIVSNAVNAGGLTVRRSFGGWFNYGADLGGETIMNQLTARRLFNRYNPVVRNFEVPGTTAYLDTAVHEGVHAFIGRRLPIIWDLGNATFFRVPVGAPVIYAEELLAYTAGRLATARLHALPFVAIDAFSSLQTLGQKFVVVVTVTGGVGYGIYQQANK